MKLNFQLEHEVIGMLAMAKKKASGLLPSHVLSDTYFIALLDGLIENLAITAEIDISQIAPPVVLDSAATAGFWQSNNRASNFLKHADKDSEAASRSRN